MFAAADRSGAPRRLGEPGAHKPQYAKAYVGPDDAQIAASLRRTDGVFGILKRVGVTINLINVLWVTGVLVWVLATTDDLTIGIFAAVMAMMLGASWIFWKIYDDIWDRARARIAMRTRYTTVSAADFDAELARLAGR